MNQIPTQREPYEPRHLKGDNGRHSRPYKPSEESRARHAKGPLCPRHNPGVYSRFAARHKDGLLVGTRRPDVLDLVAFHEFYTFRDPDTHDRLDPDK